MYIKLVFKFTLTRALRARRARPPEVPEKAPYLAALLLRESSSSFIMWDEGVLVSPTFNKD